MEKRISEGFCKTQKVLKRFLFLISLICSLSTISLDVFAYESIFEQNYTLSLSFQNARMEQILDAISKQSGIKLAYSNEELASNKKVSVNLKTSNIEEALKAVLGNEYTFRQIDDYIAIARRSANKNTPAVPSVNDERSWTIQGQTLEQSEPPLPLPGVNISIKGTQLGTISDMGGYFSLKAKKGDIIVFSYLGFKNYEYVVSRAISNLSVSLTEDIESLDEVIVTGFSEEKKLNSISSISSLNVSSNLISKPVTSMSQALQGGITGLSVSQGSGLPGADAAINKTRDGSDPVNYPNTDWTDFLFKNGSVQSHSVSVSGGGNLARFALTANYLKNDGLVENTNSDRLNIRANTSVSLLDNLSVNMDFNSYRTNREKPLFDNGGDIFTYIYSTPPNTVIRYPMKEGNDIVYYGNRPEQRNPAAILDRGGIRTNLEDNISINIAPRWEVIPKLILRGQYSYRISSSAQRDERKAYNFFDYNSEAFLQTWGASYSASKDRSSYYYIGATAEYTWEKKKHRLFGIGGYNQELTNQGDWDRWSMTSIFAKVNYTFDRRYLLEGTIRRDGSSRFGKGNKFGVFPSIAAGWNLHEESFMKPLKNQINEFKVRGSYGLLGNENIGLYKYQTLIDAGNGNETVFGNPDITWETVNMLNIGADIRLFRDWTITFDYYDKLTKDMIIIPPISFIGGISAAPLNSGEVRNRGWEFDVNYGKQYKTFGFNVHAGLSQNKNKIESLFGAPYDNGNRIHEVGHALNSYYVYPTDGLLQESDFTKDTDGKWIPKEGVTIFDGQQPGDIKYRDVSGPDGTPDGKITTDDRVIRGDDQPDLNYFANLSLTYKKWDFEILFQGVTGVDAYYNEPYSFGLNVSGDGQTPLAVQTDYWTPENTGARYPRMAPNSTYGSNYHTSDFWHFNASYCRVKYIQLGYTFDQLGLKKIGISNIRLYLNAQNPFTFAKEKLTDPESRGQKGSYPLIKTYSAGISLNF